MANRWCVWFSEIDRGDIALAGGKGANLGEMTQAGLPIPPGFVITSQAFRQVVENEGLWQRICELLVQVNRHEIAELQAAEPRIRALFEGIAIPAELRTCILDSYHLLGNMDRALPVAVRSSATAEDLEGASFAGQQETILNVIGDEALLNAVRRCWSSLFTCQAMFYRCQRGFDDSQVSMAVVVQQMVNSEKSGVSFTVEPVLRNPYEMVIESVWGLGEGIVSGALTPDHYQVDRDTYEIVTEFVPDKPTMFCQAAGGGVQRLPVPADRVSVRVLTDDELKRLVDMGNRVEAHFGYPQDIEWGIEGQNIYLLQSRPITCL
jgi:pyruvate,water dikinase